MSGLDQLGAALVRAQRAVRDAGKDRANPSLRNQYATLASVLSEVRPAFHDSGISVIQAPGPIVDGRAVLTTTLLHESGQSISFESSCPMVGYKGSGADENKGINAAQAYGVVITYLRRYALMAVAAITAVDDDTDGDVKPRRDERRDEEPRREPAREEPPEERPLDAAAFLRAMQAVDPAWTAEAICAIAKVPSLDALPRARADAAYAKAKSGEIRPPKPTTTQPAAGGEDDIP